MKTPIASMLLVVTASVIGSFGAVFLKFGALNLELTVMGMARNWRLMIGIALYLLSSAFFMAGIRNGELTILYPMVSLGYIWTMIWSRIVFKEPITQFKVMGLGMIVAGIAVLNMGR
jgi:multidrug transporter EmrE-like cation transporter